MGYHFCIEPEFFECPETLYFESLIGPEALGCLLRLTCWCYKFEEEKMGCLPPEVLASAAKYSGDPKTFVDALRKSEYIVDGEFRLARVWIEPDNSNSSFPHDCYLGKNLKDTHPVKKYYKKAWVEETVTIPDEATYTEKLKDTRWKNLRNQIMRLDGWKCTKCGSKDRLQVHHLAYHNGKAPWEYDKSEMTTLCTRCHQEEPSSRMAIMRRMKREGAV